MPHWLAISLAACGSVTGLVAFVVAVRRVTRALRDAWRQLMALLGRIEAASKGVQQLSTDLHELAGSTVQLVVAMVQRQQRNETELIDLTERVDSFAELYIDLSAAVARLRRIVGGLHDD